MFVISQLSAEVDTPLRESVAITPQATNPSTTNAELPKTTRSVRPGRPPGPSFEVSGELSADIGIRRP